MRRFRRTCTFRPTCERHGRPILRLPGLHDPQPAPMDLLATNDPSACCLGLFPVAGLLASDDLSVGVISTSRHTTAREIVPSDHPGPIHPLLDFSLTSLSRAAGVCVPPGSARQRADARVLQRFALSVPGPSEFMSQQIWTDSLLQVLRHPMPS